jgi:pimeloyl-ACP methyl ester carboxylesterase
MPAVEKNGATLYYEEHGDPRDARPAIVFVHGSGGSALSWWQQLPVFAARHRVVAFDHRGFFRSTCATDALDPGCFAGDLAAILDAAGIERAALVCQSMGGWTGLAFALAHPERTAALVLAGTPGGISTAQVDRDRTEVPKRIAERGFLGMALARDFLQRDPVRSFLYERIGALNPPATLPAVLPKLAAMRVDPAQLGGFRVPTLVLVGTDDAFFSVDGLREVAGVIPGARFVVMQGAGHSAYFEQPEQFNPIVQTFLEETGAWRASS